MNRSDMSRQVDNVDGEGPNPQPIASSSASAGSSAGTHKLAYSKRGKITIVACISCRKRKTKVQNCLQMHQFATDSPL